MRIGANSKRPMANPVAVTATNLDAGSRQVNTLRIEQNCPLKPVPSFRFKPIFATRLSLLLCIAQSGVSLGASTSNKVEFNREIRPILAENCYKCHGPDDEARKAKLRFDLPAQALKPAK